MEMGTKIFLVVSLMLLVGIYFVNDDGISDEIKNILAEPVRSDIITLDKIIIPVYTDSTIQQNGMSYFGFENGWQGWIDGGSDAALSTAYSKKDDNGNNGGVQSIRLRDDSSGSNTRADFDFTDLNNVTINFWAYYNSIESGEYLAVLCEGNEVFRFYGDGNEGSWMEHTAFIDRNDCSFTTNTEVRFVSEFSSNADQVYIDGVDMMGDHPDPWKPNVTSLTTDKTSYMYNETVIINATVVDEVIVQHVVAVIEYPSGKNKTVNMTHLSGDEYYANVSALTDKGQYTVRVYAYDSFNNINDTQTYTFNRITMNPIGFDAEINDGAMNFVFEATNNVSGVMDVKMNNTGSGSIGLIEIEGFDATAPGAMIRLAEESDDASAHGFTDTFVVDPTGINFTSMNITFTAVNTALAKCTDYDFDLGKCGEGGYSIILDGMTPGLQYTVTIDPVDPAFGQQISGAGNTSDTYTSDVNQDNNFGAETSMLGGTKSGPGEIYTMFVRFNLASIPDGANIETAEVSLYQISKNGNSDLNYSIHKVTRNWSQGSGANVNNSAGVNGTTYLDAWYDDSWTSPAGDYNTSFTNWTLVDNVDNVYKNWNVTHDIQGYLSGQFDNYGWIIISDPAQSGNFRREFGTSENGVALQRPQLIVNWTTIGDAPTANTTYFNGADSTDFSMELDYFNVNNVTLSRSNVGSVRWYGTNNVSGLNFDNAVVLGSNNITVFSADLPTAYNTTAEVIMRNLGYAGLPILYKDGVVCGDCTIISYADGVLTFNTTSFSSFTTIGNSSLFINDSTDTVVTFKNEVVNFTANYSDGGVEIAGATCLISFNDTINQTMVGQPGTLINYWNFDEGSGTTFASQVTGTNGDFGGTMNSSQWQAGVIGNAAFTDGGNSGSGAAAEWLDSNYGFAFSQQDSFSLCVWMSTTDTTSGAAAVDLGSQQGANRLSNQRVGGWDWIMSQGGNSQAASTITTDGSWNQYCLVRDVTDDSFQAWKNGVLTANSTDTTTGDLDLNTADLFFGARNLVDTGGARDSVNSAFDEVSFWNKSLTASDVSYLYNSGSGRTYAQTLSLDVGSVYTYSRTFSEPGNYTYNVSCTAADETPLFAEDFAFITTNNPANLTILNPLNNSIVNESQSVNFTFNYSDDFNVSNASLLLWNTTGFLNQTDANLSNSTGTFGFLLGLLNGAYTYFIQIFDDAGNVNQSENISFTIDVAVNITSCGQTLTEPGTTYNLINEVDVSSGTCLDIQADNVTLNCGNFRMIHSGGSTVTVVNSSQYENIAINNCEIVQASTGQSTAFDLQNTRNISMNNITVLLNGTSNQFHTGIDATDSVGLQVNDYNFSDYGASSIDMLALEADNMSDASFTNMLIDMNMPSGSTTIFFGVRGTSNFNRNNFTNFNISLINRQAATTMTSYNIFFVGDNNTFDTFTMDGKAEGTIAKPQVMLFQGSYNSVKNGIMRGANGASYSGTEASTLDIDSGTNNNISNVILANPEGTPPTSNIIVSPLDIATANNTIDATINVNATTNIAVTSYMRFTNNNINNSAFIKLVGQGVNMTLNGTIGNGAGTSALLYNNANFIFNSTLIKLIASTFPKYNVSSILEFDLSASGVPGNSPLVDFNDDGLFEPCSVCNLIAASGSLLSFSVPHFTSYAYNITATFEDPVYETQTTEVLTEVTLFINKTVSNILFNYSNTNYTATFTNSSVFDYNISVGIDVPLLADENVQESRSFNFLVVYDNGTIEATSILSHTVRPLNLTLCEPTNNVSYLNFTFKNESTPQVPSTATITGAGSAYLGTGNVTKTVSLSGGASEAASVAFCQSPSDKRVTTDIDWTYDNSISQQRSYSPGITNYTNATTNVTLLLLPSGDGQFISFTVQDAASSPLSDAKLTFSSSGDVAETVQTGASGTALAFLSPLTTYTLQVERTGCTTLTQTDKFTQSILIVMACNTTSTDSNGTSYIPTTGINYTYSPAAGTRLATNTSYTFVMSLTSTTSNPTNIWGFNLVLSNGTVVAAVNTTSTTGTVQTTYTTPSDSAINKLTMIKYYNVSDSSSVTKVIYIPHSYPIITVNVGDFVNSTDNTGTVTNFFTLISAYTSAGVLFGLTNNSLVFLVLLSIALMVGYLSITYGFRTEGTILSVAAAMIIAANFIIIDFPPMITFIAILVLVYAIIKEAISR